MSHYPALEACMVCIKNATAFEAAVLVHATSDTAQLGQREQVTPRQILILHLDVTSEGNAIVQLSAPTAYALILTPSTSESTSPDTSWGTNASLTLTYLHD